MIDLPKHIPDVDLLLALQPEELASRLLFLQTRGELLPMPHVNVLSTCIMNLFAQNNAIAK